MSKLVRNTLNLNKTIKQYTQTVKVIKRQINVKLIDPISKAPDFSFGTFAVNNVNTVYSLVLRCTIPINTSLLVDIWGMGGIECESINNTTTTAMTVHRLNQLKISQTTAEKEIIQKFQTYPKTKEIFFTFKLVGTGGGSYIINNIYLDSRYPLAIGIDTSPIPSLDQKTNLNFGLNIQCTPTMIVELDLDNPLKVFDASPINVDLFGNCIINYFLNEHNALYLQALKFNISNCMSNGGGGAGTGGNDNGNDTPKNLLADLVVLQDNIKSQHTVLNTYVNNMQKLMQKKQLLDKNNEKSSITDVNNKLLKYEDKVVFLNKFLMALSNKQLYLQSLQNGLAKMGANGTNESDYKSITEILDYYKSRIGEDKTIIEQDLNVVNEELKVFSKQILEPHKSSLNSTKEQLIDVEKQYQEQSSLLEEQNIKINHNISVFILKWYYWITKQMSSLSYNS